MRDRIRIADLDHMLVVKNRAKLGWLQFLHLCQQIFYKLFVMICDFVYNDGYCTKQLNFYNCSFLEFIVVPGKICYKQSLTEVKILFKDSYLSSRPPKPTFSSWIVHVALWAGPLGQSKETYWASDITIRPNHKRSHPATLISLKASFLSTLIQNK